MKIEFLYRCDKCSKTYKTQKEAEDCENGHLIPVKIIQNFDYRYGSIEPDSIIIKFKTGQTARYFFDAFLETEEETKGE